MKAFPTRIGFVLLSNRARPLPSTRIAVLNMLSRLQAAGFDCQILFEPESFTETPDLTGLATRAKELGCCLVFFQKVHGTSVRTELQLLRQAGIRTVYGVCDRIDDDMVRATDATVIVTQFLKDRHTADLQDRIHVVHDGIERPERVARVAGAPLRRTLRATMVTSGSPSAISIFSDAVFPDLTLTVIGNYSRQGLSFASARQWIGRAFQAAGKGNGVRFGRGFRAVNWHPDHVYDELEQADIGVIPVDMRDHRFPGSQISVWQVKSENRLTLLMGLGLPVVASPVPAYLDVVQQGVNGYLASSVDEWKRAIHALRDPQHRCQVGIAARASVIHRFSMDAQALKLTNLFETLVAGPALLRT